MSNYVVTLGHAVGDERGKVSGGAAGDQTGKEVRFQPWYLRSQGWTAVLRASDEVTAGMIADAMELAVRSPLIGYDQKQRTTLFDAIKNLLFDIRLLRTPVETDCSALISVCCNYAGIKISKDMYTGNELDVLLRSGRLRAFFSDDYTKSSKFLRRGDILLGPGHTAIVVNTIYHLERQLQAKAGTHMAGADVLALQERLNHLGASLAIDGDYGAKTKAAVQREQARHGLQADGIVGKDTAAALGFLYK